MFFILDLTTNDLPVLKIMYFIKSLLSIVSIIVPVILIVMVTIDLIKTLLNPSDSKKHTKSLITRTIMALCIFFIPILVNFIMGLIGQAGVNSVELWTEANKNNVEKLQKQKTSEDEVKRNESERKSYISKSQILIKNAKLLLEKDDKYVSQDSKQILSSLIENLEAKINDSNSDINAIKTFYDELNLKVAEVRDKIPNEPVSINPNKYIFVGDSRTVAINDVVGNPENTTFIAKVGIGYSWFSSTAIPSINNIINSSDTPYYIFFNLGVNDAVDGSSANRTLTNNYIATLVSLARNEWKNQKIIVISVMPTSENTTYNHKNSAVIEFNSLMRSGIEGNDNLLYCDVYNGIGKDSFKYESDGLHYTNEMSKTIYDYIMNNCKL